MKVMLLVCLVIAFIGFVVFSIHSLLVDRRIEEMLGDVDSTFAAIVMSKLNICAKTARMEGKKVMVCYKDSDGGYEDLFEYEAVEE